MKLRKLFLLTIIIVSVLTGTAFAAAGESGASGTDPAKETRKTANPADYAGKKVGVITGSTGERIALELFPESIPMYFTGFSDSLLALKVGTVDAVITDASHVRDMQRIDKVVDYELVPGQSSYLAQAFPKTEKGKALQEEFNAWFEEYRADGTLERLEEKWFTFPEEQCVFDDPSDLPPGEKILNIATMGTSPPLEYVKDGELMGMEIEIVREFCRAAGYQPVFSTMEFSSVLTGVIMGKYDMGASNLTVTEERKKSVYFADPFLYDPVTVAFYPAGAAVSSETDPAEGLSGGFERTFLREDRWMLFLEGIGATLLIVVCSLLFGTMLGFGLYLLCRGGSRPVNAVVSVFQGLITGMPVVVFLMILFYIVFAKSPVSGTAVAVTGFTVLFAFTMFGMLKNSEAAIDIGQKEAAYALGYSDLSAYFRIILPQSARLFLPVYESETVSLIKATAVVGYVAVVDLTKVGDLIRGRTYDAFFPLLAVVVGYFLISAAMKRVIRGISAKINSGSDKKTALLTSFIKEERSSRENEIS